MIAASALLETLVLAVAQGIAEFLPISSKGHLVILGALMRRFQGVEVDDEENLLLIVVLHFGTLLSLVVVYRAELRGLLRNPRLCAAIVLATIPAGALGFLLKDRLEEAFQSPLLAGCGLLVTAALLWIAQRCGRNERTLERLTFADALLVGLFQVAALLPGISRSGTTISGGLIAGLRREAAAAFSFLIAIPIIAAATLLTVVKAWQRSGGAFPLDARYSPGVMAIGAAVSFGVGVVSLRWLLRLISQRRLHWFSWYCAAAGLATIAWQLWERSP
jgi:undecaprenyl-diphosphatase